MERETSIRAHHLAMWGDVLQEYLTYSKGKKPWEIPHDRFFETEAFVIQFAKKQTEKDLEEKRELEKYDIDNEDAEDEYSYRVDLVGTTVEEYQKVLSARTRHFMEIFEAVTLNKNTPILLSALPDGYCKACAIGNHCHETGPDYADNDVRHFKVLKGLPETYREKGMVGVTKEGIIFITAELLFDEDFQKIIKDGVRKERERSWV